MNDDIERRSWINYKYAGLKTRFYAHLLDSLFVILLYLVSVFCAELVSFNVMLLYPIIYLIYYISLESSRKQATYGMRMRNIIIIDSRGNKISFLRSLARIIFFQIFSLPLVIVSYTQLDYSLIYYFTVFVMFIIYVCQYFHPRKQAYYDIICNTYVVHCN